jgi:hypothetical protein
MSKNAGKVRREGTAPATAVCLKVLHLHRTAAPSIAATFLFGQVDLFVPDCL